MDLEILRHSTSHVMAQAVKELWPDAKLGIGPSIEHGFYYDFDIKQAFAPEDLGKIEKKMRQIIKQDQEFIKKEMTKKDAIKFFEKAGEKYRVKSSLIVGLGETTEEIDSVLHDLCGVGCTAVTLGQYLAPSKKHYPVHRFYTPEEFEQLALAAKKAGIEQVASGPLVRSSYQAHKLAGRGLHVENN